MMENRKVIRITRIHAASPLPQTGRFFALFQFGCDLYIHPPLLSQIFPNIYASSLQSKELGGRGCRRTIRLCNRLNVDYVIICKQEGQREQRTNRDEEAWIKKRRVLLDTVESC